MADLKISQLNSIVTVVPATDVLPVVQGGTTLKITPKQILESGSPAVLASATITGDLTVRTNKLAVTSTGVGFGNTSPSEAVDVTGNAFVRGDVNIFSSTGGAVVSKSLIFGSAANISAASIYGLTNSATAGQLFLATETGGVMTDRLQISDTGVFSFLNVGGVAGTAMTLNATGLGVGVVPIASHVFSCAGPIAITGNIAGTRTSYIANSSAAAVYYTDGGGSGYFTDFGNLIIQPRTNAARSVVFATGSTTPVERAVVKSTGQVRFVPLAADPAGAESGDIYYNSVSNKLKCYNGSTWNDLF